MADLTEEMVTNPAQALAWISKGESKMLFFAQHNPLGKIQHVPFLLMFREPTLWKDEDESAKQPLTHHF